MSHVFSSAWLVRRGSLGWATHEAWFPRTSVLAHIQLSALSLQGGEGFEPFARQYALAYLETENTPIGERGYPRPNKETDNHVWLETDHVTFELQAAGVVTCSAFGLIHDVGAGATGRRDAKRALDVAVFDPEGEVVGTHRVVQLDGGREPRVDEVLERVLERAVARSDHEIDAVLVDLTGIPEGAEFRIDVRTGRPVPRPGAQ